MKSGDVSQVTLERVLSSGEKNIATNNKKLGLSVSPDFRDKVEFKDDGVQSCSIVIRNVTEQDEGCCRCLFQTSPDSDLSVTTCLQIYELHEASQHVTESDSTVVSCSATAPPASTGTLHVPPPHVCFSQYNTVSVTNTKRTVAVTTTAVLSGFCGNSTQVRCAVRVLSVQKEVFPMIPGLKHTSADAE
ncbi:OX-2 membrane glycoprotein-like [Trachinotus anak]|uniref:OX-2 membrane glycoprotein-like n=1 Tax=Trachinotus anak TaxID=443729 RepID=UPI0039F20F1A